MAKRGAIKGIKKDDISPRQKLVAMYYLDRNNHETFSNKTKSYIAAGYKGANDNSAAPAVTRLFKKESFKKYLQEIDENNLPQIKKVQEITAEKARNDLLDTLELCKTKGDITNLVACVRLELQITGQLSEKIVFNIEDSRKLNESHRKQAQRIASIISEQRMLGAVPSLMTDSSGPIDAQFTEQSDTDIGLTASESPDDNISGDNDL